MEKLSHTFHQKYYLNLNRKSLIEKSQNDKKKSFFLFLKHSNLWCKHSKLYASTSSISYPLTLLRHQTIFSFGFLLDLMIFCVVSDIFGAAQTKCFHYKDRDSTMKWGWWCMKREKLRVISIFSPRKHTLESFVCVCVFSS